jgi:hypothetical protein
VCLRSAPQLLSPSGKASRLLCLPTALTVSVAAARRTQNSYLTAISQQLATLTAKLRQQQQQAPGGGAVPSGAAAASAAGPPPAAQQAPPAVAVAAAPPAPRAAPPLQPVPPVAGGATAAASAAAAAVAPPPPPQQQSSRPPEYWRELAAVRAKYLIPLEAVVIPALRASGLASVLRKVQFEVVPLLKSTPEAPVPFWPTLPELEACERSVLSVIKQVRAQQLARARAPPQQQQQQQQQQRPTHAPPQAQAPPPAPAAPPLKRRADAALPSLPDAAKRRQARAFMGRATRKLPSRCAHAPCRTNVRASIH